MIDPDFGWHLASGQYILANGLPATDIYTYTASDFPWIHHEWLADVLNATIYGFGGYPLLAIFYTALWTTAIRLMAGGKQTWKSSAIILIAVLAMAQFIAIRDTAWTVLLLAITHRIFAAYRAFLPLLFIVWANLHGGFMVGLAYISWRLIYEHNWRDSWIVPAATIATFFNPYGVRLYNEIFATLLDPTLHTKINEWQRWAIDASMIILPLLWLVPIIFDIYKKRWQGIIRFDVFMLAASILSLRHFALFALMSLPRLTAFYSHMPIPKFRSPKNVFSINRILRVIAAQLTAIIALTLVIATGTMALNGPLSFQPEKSEPTAAVASLQKMACKGNIFNHYDIGGYLIWKYPEQKVYIDGRMPSWQFNGTNYMDNYLRVTKDESFQKQQFDTYHITCAVVRSGSDIAKSLQKQGWRAEVDNTSGWALLRK